MGVEGDEGEAGRLRLGVRGDEGIWLDEAKALCLKGELCWKGEEGKFGAAIAKAVMMSVYT